LTAIPKKTPTKNQNIFNVIKYSNLLMICGKYIVAIHKTIVNIIAISLLLFLNSIEIMCQTIAPANDTTMMIMELVVVLLK
jgi:hypothetical protein